MSVVVLDVLVSVPLDWPYVPYEAGSYYYTVDFFCS